MLARMNWSELYHYYNVQLADPRTNDWALVANPLYVFATLIGYTFLVLKWGPQYMKNRKPYSLKTFLLCYNVFQIVSNAYIAYTFFNSGWSTEYTLGCEPTRYTSRPIDLRMANIAKWAFLVKIVDLSETVVFVLRKKQNQISFLHLYHHISTVVVSYFFLKYATTGMVTMQIVLNGNVHVIMYTYYLLASLGSSTQRIANFMKPWITRIQIAQLIFLTVHQSQAFLPSCPIPKSHPSIIVGNLLLNLILFLNFYKRNYTKSAKKLE